MRIRALAIKDFRAHEKSYVEFNDGINLVIGQNGSGKSSILEAIFASFYLGHGSFPRGYKKVNTRVDSKSGFELTLKFEHGGKMYEIVRKSLGESYLKENGSIIADKDSDIARWVERYLYPIHVYRNALYIRQGEIESILTDEDVREKVLRKVLGIEDYENAEKNAQEVIRELRREKEHLEGVILGAGDVKSQIEDAERKLKEVFKSINELRLLEGELKEKFKAVSSRYSQLKNTKELLEELEREEIRKEGELNEIKESITHLEERIKELQQEIQDLKGKEKRLKEIEWVNKRYPKLKSVLSKKDDLHKAKIEMSRLEQKLKNIGEQIEELKEKEKELQIKREEYTKAIKTYNELKRSVEQYEKAMQLLAQKERHEMELKKEGYTKEKLLSEIEGVNKAKEKAKEVDEEIIKIREEISGLNKLEHSLRQNLSKLEGAKECPLCKRPMEEHDEEEIMREYREEFAQIEKRRKELKEKLKELTEEKKQLESIKATEGKLLKLQKTLELLEEVEKELKGYDVEKLKKKADEFEEVKRKAIELKKEMTSINRELEKLEKLMMEKERAENEMKALNARVNRILNELSKEGFSSFEDVEEELERIDPIYREYLQLKGIPSELSLKEKRKRILEEKMGLKIKGLEKLKKELQEIKAKVQKLKKEFSKEEFERVENEYLNLSNKVASIKAEIEGQERLKEEVTKRLEGLRKQLEEVKSAQAKIKAVEKVMADMKVLREKLIKFKAEAERRGLEEVEKVASELFSEMTERKYQGIKIIREKRYGKERIRIAVLYQGEEQGIDFLSGGERIALGLSFRLALSLYKVRNLELLILDEPTPFLDEERRKKLIDIITQHLRKIPQVIIVSHDEELKDAADYVIRVSLVGGKSRVEVESLAAY
ncbi:hypothetical protein PAP_07725 [Palaeococcus pacificus DY20341]|uniref:DNA double-strand break repair Rad50 ATPase n=1 Tax=Palaeococcus pacificus DY20341 TaxID=1343739 RepID=A0A075LU85_9EURY|nr:DNA double-strand break repair ATPase Rad50 [Palaeococcus pacificus]AIF69934.1 hypothetical protein PAP_07725 [Palaeococcus pacificus DY20341]